MEGKKEKNTRGKVNKTAVLKVRMTEEDKAVLEKAAAAVGMKPSAWVRTQIHAAADDLDTASGSSSDKADEKVCNSEKTETEYFLAVPMDRELLDELDKHARRLDCSKAEAASFLLSAVTAFWAQIPTRREKRPKKD